MMYLALQLVVDRTYWVFSQEVQAILAGSISQHSKTGCKALGCTLDKLVWSGDKGNLTGGNLQDRASRQATSRCPWPRVLARFSTAALSDYTVRHMDSL